MCPFEAATSDNYERRKNVIPLKRLQAISCVNRAEKSLSHKATQAS